LGLDKCHILISFSVKNMKRVEKYTVHVYVYVVFTLAVLKQ
jgi:hypothetical protein